MRNPGRTGLKECFVLDPRVSPGDSDYKAAGMPRLHKHRLAEAKTVQV